MPAVNVTAMRLAHGARVAVIGAGPGGLAAAKHAISSGFDTTVFEASDDLGGQWHTTAAHSGIWPGMRTNTSRAMTAFSDFPPPSSHALYPLAEQIQDYLRAYAVAYGVAERIRYGTPALEVRPGWRVNGEAFDAVIVASGRFRSPLTPAQLHGFTGERMHAFDYDGAENFRGKRVLVYGNGVSGHEIASDVANCTQVVSAYRKPRYVLQKVAGGVPSDWQWYTQIGALRRASMAPQDYDRMLRARVVRVAGNPVDFGAPEPDESILVAGHSLCQDYLSQVRAGDILCRPGIAAVDGRRVTFVDGTHEDIDAIISATGYRLDMPYLSESVWSCVGPQLRLHNRTFHPDLPGLGVIGQFALQGPYLPLLELQARWIIGTWSGEMPAPEESAMRAGVASAPPVIDSHHMLAMTLAASAGVAPDLRAWPELAEALLFGPLLPPRYRLDGAGAMPDAAAQFAHQLDANPRAPIEPDDLAALPDLGLADLMGLMGTS
jgi:dimethylaniline monooxygenase (N-oxide forming)